MGERYPFRYSPRGGLRLQGLTAFLYGLDEQRVVVSFDELERVTGCQLNATLRQHQSAWGNGSTYARYWKDTGYRPSFAGVSPGHIAFVREE